MLLVFAILSAVACTPDKQRGAEDLGYDKNKAKFDSYGINYSDDNVGVDKELKGTTW